MKLSVCTITFQHANYIRESVESALAQRTDFPFEIVIGDDASTDGTAETLTELAREDSRVRLKLREQNVGMAENLFETLRRCQGEYIALLEGDDRWTDPEKLRLQVERLDADPSRVISFHPVHNFWEDGSQPPFIHPQPSKTEWAFEDLLRFNAMNTCSVVVRRAALPDPFPEWVRSLRSIDWTLNILTARQGTIDYVDRVMAEYRIHAGGVWTSASALAKLESEREMCRRLTPLLRPNEGAVLRETAGRRLFEEVAVLAQGGELAQARRTYRQWLREGGRGVPSSWKAKLGLRLLLPSLNRLRVKG